MHAPTDRKQIDRVVDAIASDELATVDRDTLTAVVEADFHRYSSARTLHGLRAGARRAGRPRPLAQAPQPRPPASLSSARVSAANTGRDQPVNRR